MSRYFLHVRSADNVVSADLEGQDLPDLEAARREAVSVNREILSEKLLHGGALDGRQIEIADEVGKILAVVKPDDVLFQNDQWRSFDDDITKSAPVANLISAKPEGE